MALVPCPDCSKEVSNKAKNCPYCGCPTLGLIEQVSPSKNLQSNQKEPLSKPKEMLIAGIAIFLVVGVILALANLARGTSTAPTTPSVQTKDPNCLYIPESSVPRGMSYGDYKEKIKRETGAKCVFFTGG
jgi:hypothetical protein